MLKIRRPGYSKYAGVGIHYVPARGLPWGAHEDSLYAGASPPVAKADTGVVPAVTAPDNFILTLTNTGVPVIQSNGSTARQTIPLDVYDWSLRRWYGRVIDYVNDAPPVILDPLHHAFTFVAGTPINDIDLSTYCIDPNGDQVSIDTADPLPPGLAVESNVLTGTPAAVGTFPVTFRAADNLGLFTLFPSWTLTVNATQQDDVFSEVAFSPQSIPLDIYTGADTLALAGLWTGDSVAIDGSGAVQGATPSGGKLVWLGDGGIYLSMPSRDAALLAWPRAVGAQSYNVYQNTVLVANVNDVQYVVSGLQFDTTYEFNITAVYPTADGTREYQNGRAVLRFSSPDPTVTPMPRKIPFPSVGWN